MPHREGATAAPRPRRHASRTSRRPNGASVTDRQAPPPIPAAEPLRLHRDPELLTAVNVWGVIRPQVASQVGGTRALATASHSIAASRGYEDGERIPVDEMIAEVARIAAATSLPVSADLE